LAQQVLARAAWEREASAENCSKRPNPFSLGLPTVQAKKNLDPLKNLDARMSGPLMNELVFSKC
jgi:hypothetical protein